VNPLTPNQPDDQKPTNSLFFGTVISRQSLGPAAPPDEPKSREKNIDLSSGGTMSPHVIDLKTPATQPTGRRPDADFGQRLAILAHRIHALFSQKHADAKLGLDSARPKAAPTVEAPVQATSEPKVIKYRPMQGTVTLRPAPIGAKTSPRPAPTPQALVAAPPVLKQLPKPVAPPKLIGTGEVCRTKFGKITVCPRIEKAPRLRHVLRFAVVALLVLLPVYALATYSGLLKRSADVSTETQAALGDLKSYSFDQAAATFADTRAQLRGATVVLAAYVSGSGGKLADSDAVLAAGESLAKAGSKVADALGALDASSDQKLSDRVTALAAALQQAEPDIDAAATGLATVSPSSLPAEFAPKFLAARADLETAQLGVKRFLEATPAVLQMLGGAGKRRYLVVFQNTNELRPTGGFIGSFALMDVEDGKIVNMEIPPGGPYDLRAGLKETLLAPAQLRLVNPRWEFQDANWFADFPASAKTLAWFYEKSGGPTVDGVVAVTSHVMERLLDVVGPIDLPEYGKTIDSRNFVLETEKAVELEYDKTTNKPKQIIADLAPKVLAQLFEGGMNKLPQLMAAAGESMATKDIQVWFRDPEIQAAADEFGWDGALKPQDGADFLDVVDTNIAGGKTDGVVAEDVHLETSFESDGSLVDTVTISRTDNGTPGDQFTGLKNIDYVRVYAPPGSELLSAEGFERPADGYFQKPDSSLQASALLTATEGNVSIGTGDTDITEESGLAVFGNWMQIEPGETRVAKISYRLPFRATDSLTAPSTGWEKFQDDLGVFTPLARHRLIVRRQAGTQNRTFSATIRLPAGWTVQSRLPETLVANGGGVSWAGTFDRDLYLGLVASVER
jgi:hypothetical protein